MKDLLPLPEVAFMPPFPNPAPPDPVGELLWVELGDLFIDPKYQRPIGANGEKNIRQVIENFSWSLFSPIVVCRREKGCFAVIDGQHRAIAALTHGGIKKVPAYCINGDMHDEAKAFAVINGAVTAITPTQLWNARVMAGDLNAVALNHIFTALDIEILKSPKPESKMSPGETTAINVLEKCFKKYGREVLVLALRTVVNTAKGNPGYLRGPLVQATCMVLHEAPEWVASPEKVLKAIRTVGIKYLWERAELRRKRQTIPSVSAYEIELSTLLKKEMP